MKKKIAALRQSRGKQVEIMQANVACSNEQETQAYDAAKAEIARLDAEIAECERLAAEEDDTAKLAERTRVLKITELGAKHGYAELAAKHVADGNSLEEFRGALLDAIAAREEQAPTRPGISVLRDQGDTMRTGFNEALRHRAGLLDLTEKQPGYQFRGLASQGLVALASEFLRAKGQNPAHMAPVRIAELAMSTTDFPALMAATANASLMAGFNMAQMRWRPLFSRRTAPNFKNQTEIMVGMNNATFPQVPESGEFKHGSLTEGSITWKLLTYGQIIAFTRQVIINDNLGALTNIPQQMGSKAAMRQNALAWAVITANATATFPGDSGATALFATGHSNLTSSGTAISVDSLGVALKTIRAQTDLGGDLIEMGDSFYLVVPTTKEQLARQYTSSAYMPTAQSGVNPWQGSFTVIASADLDASDTVAWYVFPNPVSIAPVLIYAYLEGTEAIYSETRQGFDVDGTEWKARFDFAVAAIDYRGAYKNAGA